MHLPKSGCAETCGGREEDATILFNSVLCTSKPGATTSAAESVFNY